MTAVCLCDMHLTVRPSCRYDVLHKPLLPPLYFANENASLEEVRPQLYCRVLDVDCLTCWAARDVACKVRYAFQSIDKDSSGKLDTNEVEQFLRSELETLRGVVWRRESTSLGEIGHIVHDRPHRSTIGHIVSTIGHIGPR